MRWLDSIIDSVDMNFSKLQEIVEDTGARYAAVCRVAKSGCDLETEERQQLGKRKFYIIQLLNSHLKKIVSVAAITTYQVIIRCQALY